MKTLFHVMLLILLLADAAALMGCSQPQGLDISPDFSPEEAELIQEAAEAWGPGALDGVTIHVTRDDDLSRFKNAYDAEDIQIQGHTTVREEHVYLMRVEDRATFRHNAAHEIGHALGMKGHITDRVSVMCPYWDPATCSELPTKTDRFQAFPLRPKMSR